MAEISAAMKDFAARAGAGQLEMQKCVACGVVQWPPRDVCGACLADALEWRETAQGAVVLAATTLHASMEDFFRARLPWRVGTVRLDAGPVAYAHLHRDVGEGDAVRIEAHRDFKGRGVLVAAPLQGGDDPKIADLISKREE
jgi:uncharacterized OB-fold protein